MINLLAISGKIGSGKDTVAKIIQYLIYENSNPEYPFDKDIEEYLLSDSFLFTPKGVRGLINIGVKSGWEIRKFGGKLKQIVALLIGCTVQDLEDQEFKSSPLGEEWIRYGYADGFKHIYEDGVKTTIMINKECSKEKYEEEYRVNWQTAYKHEFTPRELMQFIGTDLFRDKLLNNIWVNALFADYQSKTIIDKNITKGFPKVEYPNWIITDVRFPNEVKAVKDRGGITIRVNRNKITFWNIDVNNTLHTWIGNRKHITISDVNENQVQELLLEEEDRLNEKEHSSETALDNAEFDYVIDNNSNIPHLIEEVRKMLVHFKIL